MNINIAVVQTKQTNYVFDQTLHLVIPCNKLYSAFGHMVTLNQVNFCEGLLHKMILIAYVQKGYAHTELNKNMLHIIRK